MASQTPPPPQPLKTFHLFPSLPSELRLLIWFHFANVPRTFTILRSNEDGRSKEYFCTPAPTVLHVNRESRAFGLMIFERTYLWGEYPKYDYVNWAVDRFDIYF
ncbi:hypothetical protein B0J14DRAFT_51354 [Halenospora varia]|nr:hypothetical protein B0J14DRAFT_51354 [Halenospora varia]